ncbi:SDR family oxidoreductase [Novosphingobium sp.]|uniref:SDR family oxidoreductase n=1 Tax=Novosphingobium sp. TaxID=1874826 RepID=UPI0025EAA062|nr:SDR family oxidoreductase [Novosphingobium sp.]
MQTIEGRHAFITGGASGIGLAIARALLARGASVTVADWDQARLDALAGAFHAIRLDVSNRAAWGDARASAEAAHGPVDILCNNAGIGPCRTELTDMDPAAFDRMIAIKLTGSFNGVRCFAPGMRARGAGHVVNTASMAALYPQARLGEYGAAKAGLAMLSEVLRLELAPHGVGVSVLCPGLTSTGLPQTSARAAGRPEPEGTMPGIDAAVVAERVIAGIRGDWPYILTHGERRDAVAARAHTLLGAFDLIPDSTGASA